MLTAETRAVKRCRLCQATHICHDFLQVSSHAIDLVTADSPSASADEERKGAAGKPPRRASLALTDA